MPAGRPRLYKSPEEMEAKIEEYFEQKVDAIPTVAGLCLYLGFCERHALAQYEQYDGFSATVKKARLRIENHRLQSLNSKETFTPGLIFDLKNNHGYKDKREEEISGPGGGPVEVTRVELIGVPANVDTPDTDT